MKRLFVAISTAVSLTLLTGASLAADQTLIQAARSSDQDVAMALIRLEADVNQTSVDGTTPLHWAIYNDDLELAERLLQAGANPSAENDYASTPMTEAAVVGNAQLLGLLLNAGADVDSPNREGQTALMAVARTGKLDAAKLLVKKGADVNATEAWGGQTALMWASTRHHPEMVKFLIDSGAELDTRAISRDWERRVTSEPRVKELHSGGFTALLYAVREDCKECVRILIEAGADINKPDPDNVTALVLALLNLRFDIAKYLVEQGAEVNQWDIWGETPLYAAADTNILPMSARGDRPSQDETTGIEVARMLLERGANPDLQLKLAPLPRNIGNDRAGDYQGLNAGTSPLQRVAYGGDIPFMRLLLEYDANIDLINVNGIGPMIAMVGSGVSRGRGKTQEVVLEGLGVLIAAGGDINQRNRGGETALHVSVRQNNADVVRLLVERGADLNAKDNRGLTPMDHAIGAADSVGFGNYNNAVGELPEMVVLLTELTEARN